MLCIQVIVWTNDVTLIKRNEGPTQRAKAEQQGDAGKEEEMDRNAVHYSVDDRTETRC